MSKANYSVVVVFLLVIISVFYQVGGKGMCAKTNLENKTWITEVSTMHSQITGSLQTQDASFVLEWELVNGRSSRLNEIIKEASDILSDTYTSMELQLAKIHPEVVASEMFLKPLEPLFKDGGACVDWQQARRTLTSAMKQFFTQTDFTQYSDGTDLHFFVIAKNMSGDIVGVIQFVIMPAFDYGTVKTAFFGVADHMQGKGVEKSLMYSIFQLIPQVKKIFLHTRVTNEAAIRMYTEWGFEQSVEPSSLWVNLEKRIKVGTI